MDKTEKKINLKKQQKKFDSTRVNMLISQP